VYFLALFFAASSSFFYLISWVKSSNIFTRQGIKEVFPEANPPLIEQTPLY